MNEEFQKLIKNALAMLKEKTVVDLIEHDYDYKKSVHEHGIAEKKYTELENSLTSSQKQIIDEYLEAIDRNNTDINDLLYIAGLRDMLRFLISYGLIKLEK